jgi:hypothetical protein
VDKYAAQRCQAEISLKSRGDKPELEIKGFVTTRRASELEPLAPHIEIWCKWSCTISGLNLTDEVAVTKTRWLRKFDTSKYVRSEIPLDANEKPNLGYSLPLKDAMSSGPKCNWRVSRECRGHSASRHLVTLTACRGCDAVWYRPHATFLKIFIEIPKA